MMEDYGYQDYLEGLRSERDDAIREERLIADAMGREHRSYMDDYPEFYYG